MSDDTSWENSSEWYDKVVGAKGHYYHQQVIIPAILRHISAEKGNHPHLLDFGCGQAVLSRHLPKGMKYFGIDSSSSLIAAAKRYASKSMDQFLVKDLCQPLDLPYKQFSHATCILALQNIANPASVFKTAFDHLRDKAPLILVLNHPCFRIPRQSSWGIDEKKKLQYRRIERYMTELTIPIQTHPSKGTASEQTFSFHRPLSYFSGQLKQAGFAIDQMEELVSEKQSIGKASAMENRSRREFPLFLLIVAKKQSIKICKEDT